MKFGYNLNLVDFEASGPNNMVKKSKIYWDEIYKLIAAAGFKAIEIPYLPYSFNIGREGMPFTQSAMKTKYGSIKGFLKFLNECGIEEVTSLHISANDVILDVLDTGKDISLIYDELYKLGNEAIEVISELGGECVVISPTPEIGMLSKYIGNGKDGWQPECFEKTIEVINKLVKVANKSNIKIAVRNDFWGLAHGQHIDDFLRIMDASILYSPDLAHLAISKVDSVQVVKKHSDRVGFVRFNDTEFIDKEENFIKINAELPQVGPQRINCDLGDGTTDVIGAYKALKESGYNGWFICESKKSLNVYRSLLKTRWYVDNMLSI
jgi:inosose dehydratase